VNPASARATATFAFLLAAACGDNAHDQGTTAITDSAGVTLAVAPATDHPLGWAMTERFRLGGADEGPGSFTNANAFTTGTDQAGNIYVLDGQQSRVEVFSPTGNHIRFLGRPGGGPGEFQFPISFFVSPAGVANVYDGSKQALVRWDANGDLLPLLSLQGASAQLPRAYGDTLIFTQGDRSDTEFTTRLLVVVGSDTTVLTSQSAPNGTMVQFSCVSFIQPPVFTPRLQWSSNGQVVASTRQTPYQVDIYQGDSLVRSIRRPIPPKPTSVDDVARLYPDGMTVRFGGGGACTIPASEIMEKQGVAPSLPQIRSLVLDPQGRLWVERYTFDDEVALVDLFDAEGRYQGTLSDTGLPLGFIGTDVILFAKEDPDTGVQQVVAYQVTGV
jgi:hypothetical protein